MTDYNKQTVANLRQLLKDRSIPSTGLTRKAQIIEKLEQWDEQQSVTIGETPAAEAETAEDKDEDAPAVNDEEVAEDAPMQDVDAQVAPVADGALGEQKAALEKEETKPQGDTVMAEESSAPQATEDTAPAPTALGEQSIPVITEPTESEKPTSPSSPEVARVGERTRTPSSAPDEQQSIEKSELLPIPERSATTTAEPGTRLNTEELEADTRKRKRRSLTPELPSQDVKLRVKRARPSDAPEVQLKEDVDTAMEQRAPEEEEKKIDEQAMDDATNGEGKFEAGGETPEVDAALEDTKQPVTQPDSKSAPEKKDKASRYKDAFKPSNTAPIDTTEEAVADDRPISPALHPATPALYIRNFMRPLRPEPLRTHLISLASPPSSSPDPSIIKSLFLDNMKTHALVLFASTTAASRVRATLHGSIWPAEGSRKDLWVDFVPDNKVEDWISQEEDALAEDKEARTSGRPAKAKKYEVVYPENADGNIEAVFQEVGAGAVNAGAAPAFNPPTGPRRTSHQVNTAAPPPVLAPAPSTEARHDIEKSFKTLDELFSSTTAKPKLYFLPVSDTRSDLRLKELDLETSRDWTPEEKRKGRGMQHSHLDQKLRFGFDDEDRVVEAGNDFGPWTDEFSGGGRRGGGGGRGAFRPRGPRGGQWRSGN